MGKIILRRVLQMIPLVLGITLISFAIMQLAPGDYLTQMRANPNVRPETIERLRRDFGLDQSWPVQYWRWLINALQGDFGPSFNYKIPVFTLIKQRLYYTVLLATWSSILSWGIALPLGIYIARHRNGWADRFANLFAFAGISLPGFFTAILCLVVAQRTGWLPIGGSSSPPTDTFPGYDALSRGGKMLDTARHLVIPVLVLGLGGVAGLMRQMRGAMLEVLDENYVLAARARGLPERRVVWKHAFRNALNPIITLFGFELAGLLGGAALIENVLDWPGLGQLLLQAVQQKDIYVAMGAFVMGAFLLMFGNLIADILLALTDPRIKVQ